MQLLGVLLFVGILTLLLLAVIYLGRTQTTHNRPASSLDDLYRSRGFGNVVDANEHIREVLSAENHQPRSRRKQGNRQPHRHKHYRDEE
jgi:hypothetical protein